MRHVKRVMAAVVLAASACSAAGGSDSNAGRVLAASSLTAAFTDLQRSVPNSPQMSFAGSQALVAQVEQGAPADVIATADTATMDRLARAGRLAGSPRIFAANRLAIAVSRGNPQRITGLADLARPGTVVVLAAPQVPAGRYAVQVLAKARVRVRPASLEESVSAVLAKVALGEADAGLVYVTDIRAARNVAGVDIPVVDNVVVRYPVALLVGSRHPDAGRRFVDLLFSAAGQRALRDHGFLPPPS